MLGLGRPITIADVPAWALPSEVFSAAAQDAPLPADHLLPSPHNAVLVPAADGIEVA
jgi:hypothetical protein